MVLDQSDLLKTKSPEPFTLTLLSEKLIEGFSAGVSYQAASKREDRLPSEEVENNYKRKHSLARDSDSDGEHDTKVQGSGKVQDSGVMTDRKKRKTGDE